DPADRIADAARRAGMKSLWDSGLAHVLRGESTIDELMRVVDVPPEAAAIADLAAHTAPAAPGAHGAPAAPARVGAQPIATHFDLLEEVALPARRSGAARGGARPPPALAVLLPSTRAFASSTRTCSAAIPSAPRCWCCAAGPAAATPARGRPSTAPWSPVSVPSRRRSASCARR